MVVNDQGEQQREALEIVRDDLCRHLLAQGRQPGGYGQPARPQRDRRGDRGGSASRIGRVRADSRGPEEVANSDRSFGRRSSPPAFGEHHRYF
jgi:hypothetical protein